MNIVRDVLGSVYGGSNYVAHRLAGEPPQMAVRSSVTDDMYSAQMMAPFAASLGAGFGMMGCPWMGMGMGMGMGLGMGMGMGWGMGFGMGALPFGMAGGWANPWLWSGTPFLYPPVMPFTGVFNGMFW